MTTAHRPSWFRLYVALAVLAVLVTVACVPSTSDGGDEDPEEDGMADCTSREIDLSGGQRPTFDVADDDSQVITECTGDHSARFTFRFDDMDPLELDVRTALVARRAHRSDKDLALELRLGPWSIDEAESETSDIVEHLGLERRAWLDEWVTEARAAPVPAASDIRSRVLSADLAPDIDVSLDLARQSNEDIVFVHVTIRWTTSQG